MKAKVIKIIDDYKIVLNVGLNEKIITGNLFQIVEGDGVEVIDPDTGESYGTLDITKATVKVIKVYPKMCICENNAQNMSYVNDISIHVPPKRLRVNLNDVSGGYNENNVPPIKLGDIAYLLNN